MSGDVSTNPSQPQQNPQQSVWSAHEYEAALSHLETLQEQLNILRSTIPSLVAPLLSRGSSKQQTYAQVTKAAYQTTDDLARFREEWTSERTQDLLVRGRESLGRNGDLSRAGEVARFGWCGGDGE